MIKRLLIANRGEIAIRVARACRETGIESVAVYSDADADAAHVDAADRSVHIGAAAAIESYLSIPKILQAIDQTQADAVHPGYGFLSENARFAAACEQAGVTFVGPPSRVIAAMGSKINARRMIQDAGIPIVPGETPADQSDSGILAALTRVGFPALVKASAGGGGKGMRTVGADDDAQETIQAARREAAAAFGDGTLYVERLVRHARHVEVQIIADDHDGCLHLFERDCSTQRRHQKVIEESPSPVVSPALRARMTDAAVRAARASGYRNAGTIEFLVDPASGEFFFLEMNTRLQVEHPVTEEVTGLDLVRAQLVVASGGALPWTQDDVSQRGHAIEARIYAEDPGAGFLPQAGAILLYREPRMPGVRIDSGIREGDVVPVHYDPMLAKVIASAATRDQAIERLQTALREYPILGIRTNVAFLLAILEHAQFRAGDVDTAFLDREGASLAECAGVNDEVPPFVREIAESPHATTGAADRHSRPAQPDPWHTLSRWRL